MRERKYKVSYGPGLDIEWTGFELEKIAQIKARRNLKPLKEDAVTCAWSGCRRKALESGELCWKHQKLIRALRDC